MTLSSLPAYNVPGHTLPVGTDRVPLGSTAEVTNEGKKGRLRIRAVVSPHARAYTV
jgi:hypothetical protein